MLHGVYPLDIDGDGEVGRYLRFDHLLVVHLTCCETAPGVAEINRVGVHKFVLRLNDALRLLLFFLLLRLIRKLTIVELRLGFLELLLVFLLFLFFGNLRLLLLMDLLLKFGLRLVDINVVNERVVSLDLDRHQTWLATLAVHVFHDLVVCRHFLTVLSQHSRDAINGGICHKLFKFLVDQELHYIVVENDIIERHKGFVRILIVPKLANSVWQLPVGTSLSIW